MKIPLSKFESVIEPAIVSRGKEYFHNEAVQGLKKLKDGEWIASVYEKVTIKELAPQIGRSNYRYLCRFLRRFQKMGYKNRVAKLVGELSEKYRNHPAMLEELRLV